MGQLTKKLDIDPCPNCESVDYELSPDSNFSAYPFHAKCSKCGFNYRVYYVPPGASLLYSHADDVRSDVFKLFARNI